MSPTNNHFSSPRLHEISDSVLCSTPNAYLQYERNKGEALSHFKVLMLQAKVLGLGYQEALEVIGPIAVERNVCHPTLPHIYRSLL